MINDDRIFMLKEVISFLISDTRKRNNLYEYDILNIFPEYAASAPSKPLLFKPVLLLLNLYSMLKRIDIYVLHEIDIPTTVREVITTVPNNDSACGRIDWRSTIMHRFKGNDGIVVKTRIKEIDSKQLIMTSMVFGELFLHAEILVKYFNREIKLNSHIKFVADEILNLVDKVKSVTHHITIQTDKKPEIIKFKNSVRKSLLLELKTPSLDLSGYFNDVIININSNITISSTTVLLLRLRSQYLDCIQELTCGSGIPVATNISTPNLYEIWAFRSLLNCLTADRENVIQNCFMSSTAMGPLLKIKGSYLVYYDNRQHTFIKKSQSMVLQAAVISGSFVEWFIKNPINYSDSFIIDTKYKCWNSGDILKVMGYLVNFGIKNGVVIFRDKLNTNSIQGVKIDEGLFCCKSNLPFQSNLYIMSLLPTEDAAEENTKRLKALADIMFNY